MYDAQKANTSPGDFCELVCEDKEMIGLELSDRSMKKEKYKNIVKQKIRQAAFEYLKNLKEGHSKMDNLSYEKFKMSSYMNSPLFSNDDKKVLLALRTRTVEGIRNYFRGMFPDISCPMLCGSDDTIEHILECTILISN